MDNNPHISVFLFKKHLFHYVKEVFYLLDIKIHHASKFPIWMSCRPTICMLPSTRHAFWWPTCNFIKLVIITSWTMNEQDATSYQKQQWSNDATDEYNNANNYTTIFMKFIYVIHIHYPFI